jgi:hypothetical protein
MRLLVILLAVVENMLKVFVDVLFALSSFKDIENDII